MDLLSNLWKIVFVICILCSLDGCEDRGGINVETADLGDLSYSELSGLVDSCWWYETLLTQKGKKTGQTILKQKLYFTPKGELYHGEYYSTIGYLNKKILKEFDENGLKTRCEHFTFVGEGKRRHRICEFGSGKEEGIKKCRDIINGDTLQGAYKFSDGLCVECCYSFQMDSAIFRKINYQYTEDKRLEKVSIFKHQTLEKEIEYVYDLAGRKIQRIENDLTLPLLTRLSYEYDPSGKLRRIWEYRKTQERDEKREFLSSLTELNGRGEVMRKKNYRMGILDKEFKHVYVYDKSGNWITRRTYLKEIGKGNHFYPIRIESREIVYMSPSKKESSLNSFSR